MPKENKKILKVQMKMLLNQSRNENNNDDINKTSIIKLLGSSNKNIPSLSKFVKIKYSESMGRCLVVTSDTDPGKIKYKYY